MSKAVIREDEWLAELERLSRKNDAGQTAKEMAKATGQSVACILARLGMAKKMGWLTMGHRTETRLDGRPFPAPVYTIRKPTNGKTSAAAKSPARSKRS